MADKPKSSSLLTLASIFTVWYASSLVTDTLNKQIQTEIKAPATLTFFQFLTGGIVTAILMRHLQVVNFIPLRKDQMPPLYQIAACWTVGFLATNMSFGVAKKGSVSFTHAVKATEPVFLVVIASLFFNRSFPLAVWLSLLPIVLGIGIVAVSDLSFTALSMAITFLANTCFVLRSLFVKKVFEAKVVDNYNVFYYISWIAAFATFFIALVLESSNLYAQLDKVSPRLLGLVLCNGLGHFTYNFASMTLLDMIAPLSHSIGNASRRLVIITGSMLYFGQEFQGKHMFGIALLMFGVFTYTYISKMQPVARPKTALEAQKSKAVSD
eukprot:m.77686 g.77686  ORF g.77686 m.77686 type:complete len:325 (+) comp14482_c0_seq4:27-1001(+)